jgi:hypothetical protein
MKQQGKCIVGDPVKINNLTRDWETVRIHPLVFYRRQDTFLDGLKASKGLHACVDMGQFILIRFSDKEDLTAFYRRHHEYV